MAAPFIRQSALRRGCRNSVGVWGATPKRINFVQADLFRDCAVSKRHTFRRLIPAAHIQLSMKSLCVQRPAKERLKRRPLARNLQNNEILRQVASNWNVRRLLVDAIRCGIEKTVIRQCDLPHC
jgi:hypothetical protein